MTEQQGMHTTPGSTQGSTERSTAPSRFQQSTARTESSSGEKAGAGLALFALVICVPVLLVLVGGSGPLPKSWPSKEWLTQPLGLDVILNVLLAVVWIAWAFFVVCVGVEVVAARRGGLARPVPLGGPVQKAARVLVGALLLTGVVAPAATAAPAHSVAPRTAVSSTVTGQSTTAADQATAQVQAEAPQVAKHEITAEEHLAGHKVYTVAAPKDGYHDNLWDIAERHLGDGRRYKEIFELNKGLVQKDGRTLHLARLIQPGWQLVMPDDAVGVARYAPAPASPTTPAQPGGDQASGASGSQGGTAVVSEDGGQLPGGLVGSGLLAATALAALAAVRRRRIGSAAGSREVEAELRGYASRERAAFLDRALRDLAAACRQHNRPLPPVYAVELHDDRVRLRLAPATPEACGSWSVEDDGRSWSHGFIAAEDAVSGEISPYPGLISLGLDAAGADVLVDLEAAGGLIAIDGDAVVGSEVAAAMALQAGTASWAEGIQVTATGLPEGLEAIVAERVQVVDDLGAAIDACEADLDRIRADVLTGRVSRRGTTPSRLLVAGRTVDEATDRRLVGLTGPGRQALSVVVAGRHPDAAWTLRVDEAGTLALDELGVTVTANRIAAGQLAGLAELFEAAREPDRPDDGGRVAIPRPVHPVDDADWATATRRVAVLGKLAVTGVAAAPADREGQVVELVTYLAAHREGVHPNVLSGALWPRGVTPDVYDAAVSRAREWLGTDPDGNAFLGEDAAGRLVLGEGVVCDWDALRSLLLRARTATSRPEELDLLRRALQLVRGEAFSDTTDGRYGWLAHEDLERVIRRVVVDAAHRLAELSGDDHDPDGGASAALAGLRADSANQLLWRDLLRARYAGNGPAGARQTLDEMGEPLRGIPLEAETEALIEEYLPDTRSAV